MNHEGKVIARFDPRENPLGEKVTAAVGKALKAVPRKKGKKERKGKKTKKRGKL
ncbi:MAG: hypothetical protein O7J95_08580 [Planctomycetota bacterium]|nr:hypothetical protein [Planctomycetota bacterium]